MASAVRDDVKWFSEVDFYTDSHYVLAGVTGWVSGWKRNGWKTSDRKPLKNSVLWQRLYALAAKHAQQPAEQPAQTDPNANQSAPPSTPPPPPQEPAQIP